MERDLRLYLYEGYGQLTRITGKRVVGKEPYKSKSGFKHIYKDNHKHTSMEDAIEAMNYIRGKNKYMLNSQFVLIEYKNIRNHFKSEIIFVS